MKRLLFLTLLALAALDAGAQCVASFTSAQAPVGSNLLRFNFASTSTYGTLVNKQSVHIFYNFGDGGFAVGPNATHDYATTGTYLVGMRLRKFDSSFNLICTDTVTNTLVVAYPSCGTTVAVSGNVGNSIRTFTATTPAGATGMTYSWNFGDGNTGTGSPVTHTYTAYGSFTATVTATRTGTPSCSYTNTAHVNIFWLGLHCDSLHANFTTALSGKTVTVYPNNSYYPGLVRSPMFDYGDGTAATSSTSHTYATAGGYVITQKVRWLDSVTSNVICQDSSIDYASISNHIYGFIRYDSLTFTGPQHFKVYLIQYNATTGMLSAVDSLSITGTGHVFYNFTSAPAGSFLIKAARVYTSSAAAGLVPTYHDSSLYWSSAQTIIHPGFGYNVANIWMKNGAATTGPGFVGGNVSLGANKGTGAAVEGANILLRNAANQVIASTLTNAAGDFSFTNIPIGTYTLYPEVMNYATTPASVTISAGSTTVDGIYFYQDDIKMNIMTHSLAIAPTAGGEIKAALSPNPATQSVILNWIATGGNPAQAVISSITGQVVASYPISGNSGSGQQVLNISSLKPGVYFVQLKGAVSGQPMKLIVQ